MGPLKLSWRLPNSQLYSPLSPLPVPVPPSLWTKTSQSQTFPLKKNSELFSSSSNTKLGFVIRSPFALSNSQQFETQVQEDEEEEEEEGSSNDSGGSENSTIILTSCLVGLLTGIGVILFNNGVKPSCCFSLLCLNFDSIFDIEL